MERPTRSTDPSPLRDWTRSSRDRKIAGVCAGIAEQLEFPVTAVRAGFVVGSLLPAFHGIGIALYLALWFLMPAASGEPSGLDRLVEIVERLTGDDPRRRSFEHDEELEIR